MLLTFKWYLVWVNKPNITLIACLLKGSIDVATLFNNLNSVTDMSYKANTLTIDSHKRDILSSVIPATLIRPELTI